MQMRPNVSIAILASLITLISCGRAMTDEPSRAPYRFLDEHYPFIEQGAEPPGRYVPSDRPNLGQQWQGKRGWRTRHGDAILAWSLGKPAWVESALYPDGSRGLANTTDHGFRRQASGDRLWIHGRIDIRPDDIVFIDGEQPVYRPPQGDTPNLEADLARDPAFLAALKDDRFALAAFQVFYNRSFYRDPDTRVWQCSSDGAAALVANLRDKGESYQDYYPHYIIMEGVYPDDRPDREWRLQSDIDRIEEMLVKDVPSRDLKDLEETQRPAAIEQNRAQQRALLANAQRALTSFRENRVNEDVLEAVRAHLARLGWRSETEADRERIRQERMARALEVLKDVKELEQRPEGATPAWAEPLRNPPPSRGFILISGLDKMPEEVRAVQTGELGERLRKLAVSGRISEQEYRALSERLPGTREPR